MPHDLRVITYEAIVAGARRDFLREGTIDMERLVYSRRGWAVPGLEPATFVVGEGGRARVTMAYPSPMRMLWNPANAE